MSKASIPSPMRAMELIAGINAEIRELQAQKKSLRLIVDEARVQNGLAWRERRSATARARREEVRRLREEGGKWHEIAEKFGVSIQRVREIGGFS